MLVSPQEALAAWLAQRTLDHRNDVVCAHAHLARRGAKKYARAKFCATDLEQVGTIGLIKAVERYDPRRATPFEAYAWAMVCGEIMHYLRDCEQLLRVPRTLRAAERKRSGERAMLPQLHILEPAQLEIAGHAGAHGRGADLEDRILLRMALDELPPRERFVVFQLSAGHTQSEVAAELGFSQRHVSRLYANAVQKMASFWM